MISFEERRAPLAGWAACGLALFGVYLYTAYPTLSAYRDSGDMAAAGLTLGVAHPPGYPLYLLLSHLWVKLLPLGSVAYRLNILSALTGAAACCLAAFVVWSVPDERPGAPTRLSAEAGSLTAFLLLALSPAYWHLSLVSEMYSLNTLVAAAILALMLAADGGPLRHRRCIYAGALLFGLGLGNHQTLLAALPGYLWIARGELFGRAGLFGRRFWRERLPALLLFTLLGFALYAYLPLRSAAEPVIDWGEPETLRNFWRMLTRADLGGVRLHPEQPFGLTDPKQWLAGLLYTGRLLGAELGWPGVLLALWGIWCGRRRRLVQGCLLAFAASGPLFIIWANLDPALPETQPIIEPHLVLPILFAGVIAGWGARDLCARLMRRQPRQGPAALLLALAAALAFTHRGSAALRLTYRGDFSAWDYGKALHASMGSGALLLDPDDPTAFALSYMKHAHGLRPDIIPLLYFRTWWGYAQLKRRHPELLPQWEMRSGQELLGTLVSRSLGAGRELVVDLPQKVPPGVFSFPLGIVYRVLAQPPGPEQRLELFRRSERARHLLRIRSAPPGAGFFTRHTIDYWASALNNLAIEASGLGRRDEAVSLYMRALAVSPRLAESWNNMGNALLAQRRYAAAEGCYLLSLRYKPAPPVIYNLGRVYLLAQRYGEAEKTLLRAIAAGGPREARNDLALVYLRTDRAQKSVDVWKKLLDEDPYYLLSYYNLGLAYQQLGRKDDAIAAVSAYAQLAADPQERHDARAWLIRLKK
ncbi:MAG: DUF2723 domain-containing protein [Elusimicrobiota bacterium]